MRLLFVTQKMDRNDDLLGAYHGLVTELAKHVESVVVICLYEGVHDLPKNVRVYSLGKEHGRRSRLVYGTRFFTLLWKLRYDYDRVLVHMNQEYLLLAGWFWKLFQKPVYLWRNHHAGSWCTNLAAAFCEKVFCTSKHSYTARYAKTVLMPVGVPTDEFAPFPGATRLPESILFLARMAPAKHADLLIDALVLLKREGHRPTTALYGDPLPKDAAYYESLKQRVRTEGLEEYVSFHPAVSHTLTPQLYSSYEYFVNCSKSGMFDKTLFEAALCGAYTLAVSDDFRSFAGEGHYFAGTPEALAERLRTGVQTGWYESLRARIEAKHSRRALAEALAREVA